VKTLLCAVLAMVPAATAVAQSTTHPLFFIERSKNANIVKYDARLDGDGRLRGKSPVEVYWLMFAADSSREDLNWIESKFAYGFDVRRHPADSGAWTLVMRARRDRPVTVRQTADTVRAEVVIGGRSAIFERMYIKSHDRRIGWPKVDYVDLFGRDLETNEPRCERIAPGKAEGAPCPSP